MSARARRLLARLCLVGALASLAVTVLPELPRDHVLVFRLEPRLSGPATLEATWARADADAPAPSGGVRLTLDGRATRNVRHEVSLPDGEYVLCIVLTKPGTPDDAPPAENSAESAAAALPGSRLETNVSHRVTLRGDETVVPVRH